MIHAGVSFGFVESVAVDPKEMLHSWFVQTSVKMIVEAILPGLVREREGRRESKGERERERERDRERQRESERLVQLHPERGVVISEKVISLLLCYSYRSGISSLLVFP